MATSKLTHKHKTNYVLAVARQLSIFGAAVGGALSLPSILASTFHAANSHFIYSESTATLYGLTLTFIVAAVLMSQQKVDMSIYRRRVMVNFNLSLVCITGLLFTFALFIGITNIIGVAPTIAESKFGNVLFMALQLTVLAAAVKVFWSKARAFEHTSA